MKEWVFAEMEGLGDFACFFLLLLSGGGDVLIQRVDMWMREYYLVGTPLGTVWVSTLCMNSTIR